MRIEIRPYAAADREILRSLLADPSLATQFDKFQGPRGLEHKLADPHLPERGISLAFADGEPAGFGFAWELSGDGARWFMLRAGVPERFRRRGIGRRLAGALLEFVERERAGGRAEVATSAWLPCEGAEALAARLGFEHERWFWLMERPRGGAPEPAWPVGVTLRTFDGSEDMLRDWTAAYNDSFAQHYRFVRAGLEIARGIAGDPGFAADGLGLAYRDGACLGFCRNTLYAARGEIATVGVVRAARGIGLGRALLRWGVRWLEAAAGTPVTLLVDGENEGALALYRAEGFAVTRTRRIWARSVDRGA